MTRWYKIEAKAETRSADVYLYDEIGGYGINAAQFIMDLGEIEADEITVHINSVGGEVFEGFAIYQALKDHDATVKVKVEALAASIASVIAMAGDEIEMARNAQFMIHDGHTQMAGNAADLGKMVAMLDRVSDNIASVYAERSGLGDVETWRGAMREESWYNADEAVAAGLADTVAPAARRRARNVADLAIFNYKGREFAPAPKLPAKEATPEAPATEVQFTWDFNEFRDALEGGS